MGAKASLVVSEDKELLDIGTIHRFLSEQSSWARGISRSLVETSIQHSLCFGAYLEGQQVGFARVITDFATFGNLVDVFVLSEHRGKGYSKQLMKAVVAHPQLQGLRRFTLATSDAHGLYQQFGFTPLNKPDTFMQRYQPAIYQNRD